MRIHADGHHAGKRAALSLRSLKPERVMALGFLVVIVIGTILLSLPIASLPSQSGRRESIGVFKAMFTATSATCVTGLVVLETGATFSLFGSIVILCLIQIGGLGFMVFATLGMVALGRRISLRNRMLIRESMNSSSLGGLVRLSLWYTLLAVSIELIGAGLLAIRFVPLLGVKKGLFYSIFHAVSAFCNAGFDLFGTGTSIQLFRSDALVLLTLGVLISLGGLGFSVILECIRSRREMRKLSLHAKLVLSVTAILLLVGFLVTLLLEWDNPQTLGQAGFGTSEKLLGAAFQSVTLRTAGFDAIGQADLTDSSKLLGSILMFIGGSPASTAGGIKTTTLAAALLMVFSVIKGQEQVNVFGKRLSPSVTRRALAILSIGLMILLLSTAAISILERGRGYDLIDILYETTSAFATVGLSSIGTSLLSKASQALIMVLMFFGRVGPLTIAFALAARMENSPKSKLNFPEEKIMIG